MRDQSFSINLPDGEHDFDNERVLVKQGRIVAIKRGMAWDYLPQNDTLPNFAPYKPESTEGGAP